MSHLEHRVAPPSTVFQKAVDWAMRIVPIGALIAIGAFFAAQQAVSPQHRVIKGLVLMLLMGLMFRFDMVYSVYLFALLFVFPSGIAIGSTNNVLMTVIPMIWAVRATSSRMPLARRSPLDAAIALFVIAHVVSLYKVNDSFILAKSLIVIWTMLTACAYFYTIYLFVDDEEKLLRLGRVMCIACALVMFTAVIELFFPGATLIPGWITLQHRLGQGTLSHQIKGLRAGGAFESHDMISDFATQLVLFIVFFLIRSRNIVGKMIWFAALVTTILAILSTANRGGTAGLVLALILAFAYFRRRIGAARLATVVVAFAIGVAGLDQYMSHHTIAVSVLDRFAKTQFVGIVPENRTMTWKPALDRAMESPLIGHGPFYDIGVGLTKIYWPHNGYLFYFYTIGIFGLSAFLWVIWRVYRESRIWRHPAIRDTPLGQFLGIAQIWFFVLCFEQLRTDHQRDNIYPFIVWMCFGVIVAGASIARKRLVTPPS
jgi:O-Antigen ligase